MTRKLILLVLMVTCIAAAPLQEPSNRLQRQKPDPSTVGGSSSVNAEDAKVKLSQKYLKKESGVKGNRIQSLVSMLSSNEPPGSKESEESPPPPPSPASTYSERQQQKDSGRAAKLAKKARKHKAFFVDYPFVPQIQQYQNLYDSYEPSYENEYALDTQERLAGNSKRYQESNIFYIRLPPTPYTFVPGLGYISQPPMYSTAGLRPQMSAHVRPARPQSIYQQPVNPFIKLPIDFVSNGKPTSVYQWPGAKPTKKPDSPITNLDNLSADFVSNGKPTSIYQWQTTNLKPAKRPDNLINALDKGPYVFNGRPTSLYLLKSDGTSTLHQPIRYPNFQDDNSYY